LNSRVVTNKWNGQGVEKPKWEWIKGQWVKGKESALWVNAVPGLRPGKLLQACPSFGFAC
jgi:hypothetical protein